MLLTSRRHHPDDDMGFADFCTVIHDHSRHHVEEHLNIARKVQVRQDVRVIAQESIHLVEENG